MISFNNIEKPTIGYALLKFYARLIFTRIFYREYYVHNLHKLPVNEPVILTINHQNTLMDALALLFSFPGNTIFLARADIFKKPMIARILKFLKIMPVYRKRDGVDTKKENEQIFQKSVDVLRKGNKFAIFPEGSHKGLRQLRTLKKGFARIAFQAEESTDFTLNIKIVPIGLDYTNYINMRSRLFINYGDPIEVKDYYESYRENAPRTLTKLRDELSQRLKKVMLHVENTEYYNTIYTLSRWCNPLVKKHLKLHKNTPPNRFYASKTLIDILQTTASEQPEKIQELHQNVNELQKGLNTLKLRQKTIAQPIGSIVKLLFYSFLLIMLFPLFVYGFINNYLPYKIPIVVSKNIRDAQFLSSVRYVVALVLFPLFYLIQFLVVCFTVHIWWIKILYLVSLPASGWFTMEYYIKAKKLIAQWRYTLLEKKKNKKLLRIKAIWQNITKNIEAMLDEKK